MVTSGQGLGLVPRPSPFRWLPDHQQNGSPAMRPRCGKSWSVTSSLAMAVLVLLAAPARARSVAARRLYRVVLERSPNLDVQGFQPWGPPTVEPVVERADHQSIRGPGAVQCVAHASF